MKHLFKGLRVGLAIKASAHCSNKKFHLNDAENLNDRHAQITSFKFAIESYLQERMSI